MNSDPQPCIPVFAYAKNLHGVKDTAESSSAVSPTIMKKKKCQRFFLSFLFNIFLYSITGNILLTKINGLFFSFPFHYFTLIVIYSFKKISRIQEPDPCISMDSDPAK